MTECGGVNVIMSVCVCVTHNTGRYVCMLSYLRSNYVGNPRTACAIFPDPFRPSKNTIPTDARSSHTPSQSPRSEAGGGWFWGQGSVAPPSPLCQS